MQVEVDLDLQAALLLVAALGHAGDLHVAGRGGQGASLLAGTLLVFGAVALAVTRGKVLRDTRLKSGRISRGSGRRLAGIVIWGWWRWRS